MLHHGVEHSSDVPELNGNGDKCVDVTCVKGTGCAYQSNVQQDVELDEEFGHLSNENNIEWQMNAKLCRRINRKLQDLENDTTSRGERSNTKRHYMCDFCPSSWTNPVLLLEHMKCHVIKTPKTDYICDQCGASYKHLGFLEHHKLTHAMEDSLTNFEISPLLPVKEEQHREDIILGSCLDSSQTNSLPNRKSVENNSSDSVLREVHICDHCDMKFKSADDFLQHKIEHGHPSVSLWYECPECKLRVRTSLRLKNHLLTHSDDKPHQCEVCPRRFRRLCDLNHHRKQTHRREKPYVCDICEKSFAAKSSLVKHRLWHDDKKPFKCSWCQKGFGSPANLQQHMLVHTGERPFECSICDSRFTASSALRIHMVLHTGKKPHKCDVCSKTFSSKSNLQSHAVVHTGIKRFQCDVCSKTFAAACSLKIHLQLHLGLKPHVCDICEKSFVTAGCLQAHRLSHTTDRPYGCCSCEKAFKTRYALKQHLLVHSQGGTKHVCKVPEKSCAFLKYLKAKMLRMHMCTVCGKGFATPARVRLHMITHTGEKSCTCSLCGQGFSTPNSLKIHMRLHNGLKPYSCETCGKQFTQIGNLNVHQSIHTVEKPFKCSVCLKGFNVRYRLKNHLRTHEQKAGEIKTKRKQKQKTTGNDASPQNGKKQTFKKRESAGNVPKHRVLNKNKPKTREKREDNNRKIESIKIKGYGLLDNDQPGEPLHEEVVELQAD